MKADPLLHQEALKFIRLAISKDDPKFARSLAATIKNICESGQANRQEIWAELSPDEREQFRCLLELERPEVRSLSVPPIALGDNPPKPESCSAD